MSVRSLVRVREERDTVVASTWKEYIEQLQATHGKKPIQIAPPKSGRVGQEKVKTAFGALLRKIRIHLIRVTEIDRKHDPKHPGIYEALLSKSNIEVVNKLLGEFGMAVEAQTAADNVCTNLLTKLLDLLSAIPYRAINEHQVLNYDFINFFIAVRELEMNLRASPLALPNRPSPEPIVIAHQTGQIDHSLHTPRRHEATESVPSQESKWQIRLRVAASLAVISTGGAFALVHRNTTNENPPAVNTPSVENRAASSRREDSSRINRAATDERYIHAVATHTVKLDGHDSIARPTLATFFSANPNMAASCLSPQVPDVTSLITKIDARNTQNHQAFHTLLRNVHAGNGTFTIMWNRQCNLFRFVPGDTSSQRTVPAIPGEVLVVLPTS